MSKSFIALLCVCLTFNLMFCGKKQEKTELSNKSEQAPSEKSSNFNKYAEQPPLDQALQQPTEDSAQQPHYGPYQTSETIKPGTCEEAAFKFANALTSLNTDEAISYCVDTMQAVVRAIHTNNAQAGQMRAALNSGFKITKVRVQEYREDSTICLACVTAYMNQLENEGCSFLLHKINGKWLIIDFGF